MRFATWETDGRVVSGVVSDDGLHELPARTTVLDLVRAGLPAALEAGAAALEGPAVPLESVRLLPPLQAPTVRDFVAFEEHVEGMVAPSGEGVAPEWYQAPTFYFTNPYALIGAHEVQDRGPVGECVQAGGPYDAGLHAVLGLPGGEPHDPRRIRPGARRTGPCRGR